MPPFLIAQTPRACLENHCIVIPPHLAIPEREVFNRLSAAIYQPEGKDYIAVSNTVEQTKTCRQGHEVLVLVGLDVKRLSDTEREQVRSKLKYYLAKFEILVTKTINWEQESGGLVVPRPELEIWEQDNFFHQLPRVPISSRVKAFLKKKISGND
jgi:hypothetical protein